MFCLFLNNHLERLNALAGDHFNHVHTCSIPADVELKRFESFNRNTSLVQYFNAALVNDYYFRPGCFRIT